MALIGGRMRCILDQVNYLHVNRAGGGAAAAHLEIMKGEGKTVPLLAFKRIT